MFCICLTLVYSTQVMRYYCCIIIPNWTIDNKYTNNSPYLLVLWIKLIVQAQICPKWGHHYLVFIFLALPNKNCNNHFTMLTFSWHNSLYQPLIVRLVWHTLIMWPPASEWTLICHTSIRRNSIKFLYDPGHVTFWYLEIVPAVHAGKIVWVPGLRQFSLSPLYYHFH